MNFIQAILMGIVQGLSEFLPISSSAHLVFTSNFYKVIADEPIHAQSSQEIFFDIMVHLGTLAAVLIFFRKDIVKIIKAFVNAINQKNWSDKDAKIGLFIIIGTVVSALIAYPINDFAALTSLILFFSEYLAKYKEARKNEVDFKTSVLIGIAQGLAALPGFSRSGWTIATGLFCGLDRVTAARYSFLLSIPIILGASMVYPLVEINLNEISTYNWGAIFAGTLVSGVVGYLCIKYFMKFLAKFSMNVFACYCFVVGLFTMIFFTIN